MNFNATIGVGYGLGLAAGSFFAAGAGHGTYLPMAVSSAPAALFGIPVGFLGAPILWAGVGALAVGQRAVARWAVIVHYVAAVWLVFGTEFGDFEYVLKTHRVSPWLLPAWGAFYLIGQAVVWRALFRRAA